MTGVIVKMSDILNSLKHEKELQKYVKEALARGGRMLVIDENINSVEIYLSKKNYTTIDVTGLDSEIKHKLKSKIFITNDTRQHEFDKFEDMSKFVYGLIVTPNQNEMDAKIMADAIEEVLMQANFAGSLLQVWQITKDGKFEKKAELLNDI